MRLYLLLKVLLLALTSLTATALAQPDAWNDLVRHFERRVEAFEEPDERPTGIFYARDARVAAAQPSAWAPLADAEPVPPRIVMLVHGLDEPGDIWTDLAPAIAEAGHFTTRFEYPNDQQVGPSATALLEHLRHARAAGIEEVAIVAHSMGGLVAFEALTRDSGYAGDPSGSETLPRITRLVTIGTPWSGSPWARLRVLAEVREQVQRWSMGESWDLRPLLAYRGDETGGAGEDLAAGSRLVTTLKQRPTPPALPFTVIAGRIAHGDQIDLAWLERSVLLRQILGRDRVTQLATDLREAVDTLGDGVVPLESAVARDAPDTLIFDANHRGLIRRTPVDFATGTGDDGPPAIKAILERLAPPPQPEHP